MWPDSVRDAIISQQRENVERWTPAAPNVTRRRLAGGSKNSVGEWTGRTAADEPLAVYLYAIKADRRDLARTGIAAPLSFTAATLERVLEVGDVLIREGQPDLEVKTVEPAELDGILIHWRATCEARR